MKNFALSWHELLYDWTVLLYTPKGMEVVKGVLGIQDLGEISLRSVKYRIIMKVIAEQKFSNFLSFKTQ